MGFTFFHIISIYTFSLMFVYKYYPGAALRND